MDVLAQAYEIDNHRVVCPSRQTHPSFFGSLVLFNIAAISANRITQSFENNRVWAGVNSGTRQHQESAVVNNCVLCTIPLAQLKKNAYRYSRVQSRTYPFVSVPDLWSHWHHQLRSRRHELHGPVELIANTQRRRERKKTQVSVQAPGVAKNGGQREIHKTTFLHYFCIFAFLMLLFCLVNWRQVERKLVWLESCQILASDTCKVPATGPLWVVVDAPN